MTEKSSEFIDWKKYDRESEKFKNSSPTKWVFIENFLEKKFYNELKRTYPKFDSSWEMEDSYDKLSYRKYWKMDEKKIVMDENDERYSNSWNDFMRYVQSKEFCQKLFEFTGVPVTNLKHFGFMLAKKNGFQLPHIHNVSDKTLMVFFYFSEDWLKGDPGATYLSDGIDEKKIIFEPYNLDNSTLFVLDGPHAAHGVRKITKDVERKAIQLTYEPYSSTDGWYGKMEKKEIPELLDL